MGRDLRPSRVTPQGDRQAFFPASTTFDSPFDALLSRRHRRSPTLADKTA
jgi:hypothetical protein